MAALPYMQFYVADYLADTMHLSAEEHGAYLLLIFNYWQTGKPIQKSRLAKIARMPSDRWTNAEGALSEFFRDADGCWKHDRIEADLQAAIESQAQRAAAGKASAEARKAAKRELLKNQINDRSTTVENSFNENPTNKEENRVESKETTPSSGDDAADQKPAPVHKAPEPEHQAIADIYNEMLGEFLPEVLKINKKRKNMINARWKEVFGKDSRGNDLGFWRRYFLHVSRSKSLTGTKDGFNWRPGFDWLLNESNMTRVIEGEFHQGDDRRVDYLREAS
jgi:uncharacterized protein YdaU (DUF1376 family)